MTKTIYKKMRQALRINKDFCDYDTIKYWANGSREDADAIYFCESSNMDHLFTRALRLKSGKLTKMKKLYSNEYFLTVR